MSNNIVRVTPNWTWDEEAAKPKCNECGVLYHYEDGPNARGVWTSGQWPLCNHSPGKPDADGKFFMTDIKVGGRVK